MVYLMFPPPPLSIIRYRTEVLREHVLLRTTVSHGFTGLHNVPQTGKALGVSCSNLLAT